MHIREAGTWSRARGGETRGTPVRSHRWRRAGPRPPRRRFHAPRPARADSLQLAVADTARRRARHAQRVPHRDLVADMGIPAVSPGEQDTVCALAGLAYGRRVVVSAAWHEAALGGGPVSHCRVTWLSAALAGVSSAASYSQTAATTVARWSFQP